MRRCFLLLLALMGCLCAAQDMAKPVSYTTRAKATPTVLLELSKVTGVELVCAAELAEEPLILKLNQVPLKEAMDKIAQAIAGEWKKTDRGFRLESGPEARRLHDRVIDERARFFTKSLKELERRYGCDRPFDDKAAEDWAELLLAQDKGVQQTLLNRPNNPAHRAFFQAMQLLDPREVGELHVGPYWYYSTDPNRFQRQIRGAESLLHELVGNLERVSAAYDRLLERETLDLQRQFRGRQEVKAEPRGLRLFIQRTEPRQYVARVDYLGLEGPRPEVDLFPIGDPFVLIEPGQRHEPKRKDGKALELGPMAKEISKHIPEAAFQGFFYAGLAERSLSSAVTEAISHPATVDPLSFATTDLALAYAGDGLNVAICPTDRCERIAYSEMHEGPITRDAFMNQIFRDEVLLSDQGGWLVGTPRDPLEARSYRTPRRLLEELFQSIAREGYISLDSRCDFERGAPRFGDRDLAMVGAMALGAGGYPDSISSGYQRPDAGFYATLTREQKAASQAGKLRLAMSELSKEQASWIDDLLRSANMSFIPKDGPSPVSIQSMESPDLDHATIEVEEKDTFLVTVNRRIKGTIAEQGVDLRVLAHNVAENEDPANPSQGIWGTDRIRPGMQRYVTIRVVLPDGSSLPTGIYEQHFEPGRPMTLSELVKSLDPKLRAEFEANLKEMREAMREQAKRQLPPEKAPPP